MRHLPVKHPLFTKMFADCLAGETLLLSILPLDTTIIGPAPSFSPALSHGCARTQSNPAASVSCAASGNWEEAERCWRTQIRLTLIWLHFIITSGTERRKKKKIKEACQFLTSCIFIAISIFLAGREGVTITLIWISAWKLVKVKEQYINLKRSICKGLYSRSSSLQPHDFVTSCIIWKCLEMGALENILLSFLHLFSSCFSSLIKSPYSNQLTGKMHWEQSYIFTYFPVNLFMASSKPNTFKENQCSPLNTLLPKYPLTSFYTITN